MSIQAISWAIREAPVTNPTDQLVLVVLAEHAQPDGTDSFPSIATLMQETKLGRSTLFRTLTRLKDQGLIEPIAERSRGVVVYRLAMTSPAPGPVPEMTPVPEGDPTSPAAGPPPVPERDPNRNRNRQRTVQEIETPLTPFRGREQQRPPRRTHPGWTPAARGGGRRPRFAPTAADLSAVSAWFRDQEASQPAITPPEPGFDACLAPRTPVHSTPPSPPPAQPPARRTVAELRAIRDRAIELHEAAKAQSAGTAA